MPVPMPVPINCLCWSQEQQDAISSTNDCVTVQVYKAAEGEEKTSKKGCTSQKSDRSSHSARIRAACNAVTNHLLVADRGRISRASIDDPYL